MIKLLQLLSDLAEFVLICCSLVEQKLLDAMYSQFISDYF